MALCLAALPSLPANAQTVEDRRFCSDTGSNIVFYLDLTTRYDTADETSLVSGISRIFESLGEGDRIAIRTIADMFSNGRRLLDMCVPYCRKGGFWSDLFSECTAGVVINERKKLKDAIKVAILPVLRQAGELPNSEIIRTMAMSAREEYRPGRNNVLYVFSDMIENSAYLGGGAFFTTQTPALLQKLKKDGLIPELTGATIHVFGFGRSGIGGRPALTQDKLTKLNGFWTAFFQAAGAKLSLEQNLSLAD